MAIVGAPVQLYEYGGLRQLLALDQALSGRVPDHSCCDTAGNGDSSHHRLACPARTRWNQGSKTGCLHAQPS